MSVYIKGMEMPTNCYGNCPFFTQIPPGEDHGLINYCCLENWKQSRTPMPFSVEEAKHGRQDFCPLVPVPPHGDLIDRKTAYDSLFNGMVMTGYQSRALDCINEIYVPTIIPADPDKEVE